MESMQIDWMTLIQYAFALAGAGVLGAPWVKKGFTFLKDMKDKLPSRSVTSQVVELTNDSPEVCEDVDSAERIAADSLTTCAFIFRMRGNQVGVQHCLAALAELTKAASEVVKPSAEKPEVPKT
jgi:hypothetical protein